MDRANLNARSDYLDKLILSKKKALRKAPDGKLRMIKRGNSVYYYQRKNSSDTNGTYIKRNQLDLAAHLAQKKYDQEVLALAEKERALLGKYLSGIPMVAEQYYETLDDPLQEMVIPIMLTDDQYVKKWKAVPYQPKPFTDDMPKLFSLNGERVRSKSEVIIANTLDQYGIPYRYEFPLQLNNKIFYPDFTVLNVRRRVVYIWEHMGKMDDPEYVKYALDRIDIYEQNGYYPGLQLILTHETLEKPLQIPVIENIIKTFLL